MTMAPVAVNFVRYTPDVEQRTHDEAETFAKIAETFTGMGKDVAAKDGGHAVRVSHAKSTGLLTGELIVDDDLSAELAQGLCAKPGRYETLVRFAQGPGEIIDDKISTHRGMAVKVLGVAGEHIPESREASTQDFVLEGSSTAFLNSTANAFLRNLQLGVSKAPKLSEGAKAAVSTASRLANAPLKAIGAESKMLGFFGHPPYHPLSEPYFSQVPLRWGDHVAKIGFFPTEALLEALTSRKVEHDGDFNAFRTAVVEHFATLGAEFEMRVQLATDLDAMPVEDAAQEWSETDSPYRRVACLVLPPQTAWTTTRSAFFDEKLSFQPAHSLQAHRPLGQIMRARLFVYDRLADFRQQRNGTVPHEPKSIGEVPN